MSFPSGSSTLVPTALAAMRAEHPGTRISLVEAEPPRSVEMLREGDCDLALAFRYGGADHSAAEWDDLVVRPLLTDRLVGLVPQGHRLAGAERVGMAELADEPWIAGCPRCRRHLVDVCEDAGFTPRIDFATDDYPAVVGLVGAGLGVAVLPELAVESVRAKGVSTVAVEAGRRAGGRGADPARPGPGRRPWPRPWRSWSGRPRADPRPPPAAAGGAHVAGPGTAERVKRGPGGDTPGCAGDSRKRSFGRFGDSQFGAIGPIALDAGIRRCRARPISSSRSSSVRPPHTP